MSPCPPTHLLCLATTGPPPRRYLSPMASSAPYSPSSLVCLARLYHAASSSQPAHSSWPPPPSRRATTVSTEPVSIHDGCSSRQVRGDEIHVTPCPPASCPCHCRIARSMHVPLSTSAPTCLYSSKQSPCCKSMFQVF
jgi:hypothetical protein